MIKYKIEKKVEYPRELVFRALRDNQIPINEKLPNVKSSRIVDMAQEDEHVTSMSALMRGRGHVPLLLKNVIKPDNIEWYSHQKWNSADYVCDYCIEAIHFRKNVDIKGAWTFSEDEHGNTLICINNSICIDADGVRGIPPGLARPASLLVERILYSLTGPSLNRVINELVLLLERISETPASIEA